MYLIKNNMQLSRANFILLEVLFQYLILIFPIKMKIKNYRGRRDSTQLKDILKCLSKMSKILLKYIAYLKNI